MTDTRSALSPVGQARESGAFTVGDLMRVVEQRSGLILRIAFVVVALVAACAFVFLPTTYTSAAKITIDTQKNNITDQEAVLSALPTDTPTLQNQIQILTSRDLATEVIARLKLYDDPEFNARLDPNPLAQLNPREWFKPQTAPDSDREVDSIIAAFSRHLSVDVLGLSTSIAVSFSSRDPEKAARVANAVADIYLEDQLAQKRQATEETEHWLADRITVLAQQAQIAEAQAEQFKSANHLTEAADGTPLIEAQIAALNTQLVAARGDLMQKESTEARVAALAASGNSSELSQVVASPLIVQLRTQEAELIRQQAALATRYGPRNPKLIGIQTQRRDLDDKITAETQRISASLQSDVAVSRSSVNSLSGALAQAERTAQGQNMLRVKLKAMEANAASTRSTYDSFVTRLRETQGQEGIVSPDSHVISRAPLPLSPNGPSKLMLVAASFPLGLLLGLLVALFAERMSAPAVRRTQAMPLMPAQAVPVMAMQAPAPAPAWFSPPLVGDVPNTGDRNASNLVVDWPRSAFGVAVSQLLRRVAPAGASRTIVVTSADPRSSNSAIAASLVRAAALSGQRALLLDADLRRPVAAVAMGLKPPGAGLIEVLSGRAPIAKAVQVDPRSHASVLSAAGPYLDTGAVFSAPLFAELLAHLKRNCQLIVVHAPQREAMMLEPFADALLVQVDRRRAHTQETIGAVQEFAPAGNRVGVVLTD
jgi:uncharacterized protein involved in exopolysaccharide biosynthesis/Mrp family chromosome partitioning ATPase